MSRQRNDVQRDRVHSPILVGPSHSRMLAISLNLSDLGLDLRWCGGEGSVRGWDACHTRARMLTSARPMFMSTVSPTV